MANKLTDEDESYIKAFNKAFNHIIETLERAKQFKLGDYLVLYVSDDNGALALQKNSYGAPVKYKVVFVNEGGITFVKVVNKRGNPIGQIYSCAGTQEDSYRSMDEAFEWALDPDFVDSILLQDEYDPANLHRSKKDIWKAVTDHNKACKIKTGHTSDIADFYKKVNIGDTLWTSNVSFFLVQDKKMMTPKDFNNKASWKDQTAMRGPLITILTVRDKKGKIKDVSPSFFVDKALYKERPRTYRELNI